ncbi:DUF6527 family protein [Kribbella ginsengisoli]|uniref:Uncharacterized protein n=1 Tax=Kribbella ginsengisoli TaxID=363865 RepID=A0ABP6X1A1_9ACTN
MKIDYMRAEFVRSFPSELEPGRLYISSHFSTASHLCACGCGHEVVTPLSPKQWVLTFDGNVSLRPSIGNWALPCQSHYVIERGEVRWAYRFTREEVQRNRESDHRLLDTARADVDGLWTRVLRRMTRRRT